MINKRFGYIWWKTGSNALIIHLSPIWWKSIFLRQAFHYRK
jgi:hypothetical protein